MHAEDNLGVVEWGRPRELDPAFDNQEFVPLRYVGPNSPPQFPHVRLPTSLLIRLQGVSTRAFGRGFPISHRPAKFPLPDLAAVLRLLGTAALQVLKKAALEIVHERISTKGHP